MPQARTANKPATFDHLRKKPPIERVVSVPTDNDALDAFVEATADLKRAEEASPVVKAEAMAAAQAAHDAAKAAVKATTVEMRFRSIGRKAYRALMDAHPPTEEQKADAEGLSYNSETFAIALIAASCVDPVLTVEQVEILDAEWNSAELVPLWMAALEVNTQRRVVDLGKVSNGTRS